MSVNLVSPAALDLTATFITNIVTATTRVSSVILQADANNTNRIHIGGNSSITSANAISLAAGQELSLTYDMIIGPSGERGNIDLNKLYAATDATGNKLKILYFQWNSG